MKFRVLCAVALIVLACAPFGALAGIGLDELYRLDTLPRFKESVKVGSVSSYDRTGGNDDGFSGKYSFIRKDAEGLVIADLKGPGVIYRIWTPTPSDDVLEFLFDGESAPRISLKFRDLFLGKDPDFPPPLVGFGAGGYYCYVPIPFARSCVVRMRAPKVQFYQINYALYASGSGITSFGRPQSAEYQRKLETACKLFRSAGPDMSSFSCPPGAKPETTVRQVTVKPGSTETFFKANKGGRILGLRVTPSDALASKARDLMLRISFDGEAPAVLCPLGDFFGYAWGRPAMQSLLVGTTGQTNYCYFPMPYDRKVSAEIVSERKDTVHLQFEVVHCSAARTPDEGKFYAHWRRENPTSIGEPYTFVDVSGRGHLIGVVLQAQGIESGKTLFFEGDDETTIDGELTIHGTGSEDFFNGGWYDVPDRWEKRISFPLSGCLGYAKHLGRTGAYRLFLGDAYAYRQSLKQTIEHSGQKNDIPTDYCSVSYFYSDRNPGLNTRPVPLAARAVIDPKEVIFPTWWQTPILAWSFERATLSRQKEKIGEEEVRYLSLAATGDDWFGPHFISFGCEVPETGTYGIYIEAVKGPGQAKVQLFQNENPIGTPVDLYADAPAKSGRLHVGDLPMSEGRNSVMLKLVGKNERSSGLGLNLIEIVCQRSVH